MRSGHVRHLSATLLLLPLVAACDLVGGDPSPDDAVERLATALSARSLDGVELVEAPNEAKQQLADIVAELKDYPLEVTAGDTEVDDESATTTLHWAWDLPGEDWKYD